MEFWKERIYPVPPSNLKERRRYLLKRIEGLLRQLIGSVVLNNRPYFTYDNGKNSGWTSTESCSRSSRGSMKTLRFSGVNNCKRFALIMRVLAHASTNLTNYFARDDHDFYCTKRAFYYMLKNEDIKRFVTKQQRIEYAIKEVTMLLDCSPWEIGFVSTSKGLVAGDLTLHFGDSKVTVFEKNNSHNVPQIMSEVTLIRTTANFVLVIEKDSVFQKLLQEDCCNYNKCIMITGKGYPDVSTRMLVNLLSANAKLPVYALVDADPYGFEIMCMYRFGTINNFGYREQLLCPELRWLGIHQNDLIHLNVPRIRLTQRDVRKIQLLQNRSYMNDHFINELDVMRQRGKAEIESVDPSRKRFLTEFLIPMKIKNKQYY